MVQRDASALQAPGGFFHHFCGTTQFGLEPPNVQGWQHQTMSLGGTKWSGWEHKLA